MGITVDIIRENTPDKTVFFTLTDDAENEYKGNADIPLDVVDEQAYCEANIERYLLFYRCKEYPGSSQTNLKDMEQWIADGHSIEVQTGVDEAGDPVYEDQVIEKVPWTGTHPIPTRVIDGKKISDETLEVLQSASTLEELRSVIEIILIGRE